MSAFASIKTTPAGAFEVLEHDAYGRLAYRMGTAPTFAGACEIAARQARSIVNAVFAPEEGGWRRRDPRDWRHNADAGDWYVASRVEEGDFCSLPPRPPAPTPGPWVAERPERPDGDESWSVFAPDPDPIAADDVIPIATGMTEVDARRAAAAPELLEACQSLLRVVEWSFYATAAAQIARARAAVAKATDQAPV